MELKTNFTHFQYKLHNLMHSYVKVILQTTVLVLHRSMTCVVIINIDDN